MQAAAGPSPRLPAAGAAGRLPQRRRGGSGRAAAEAARCQLLELAEKLRRRFTGGGGGGERREGSAPAAQKTSSRCRYLLMKPSPSPSQVWKRRLILSSSPVLEVSLLLLPALLTSATAAAAIMRQAPQEEEARPPQAPGIPSPAAPAKCERQHNAGARSAAEPRRGPAGAGGQRAGRLSPAARGRSGLAGCLELRLRLGRDPPGAALPSLSAWTRSGEKATKPKLAPCARHHPASTLACLSARQSPGARNHSGTE